jgi:hypothetical protein
MRTQLLNIEQVTGVDNLVEWWDVWLKDFSSDLAVRGKRWAETALTQTLLVIQQHNLKAVAEGRPTSQLTAMVMAQLGEFATLSGRIAAPALPGIPLLPAPGSSRRDLGSSGPDMEEDGFGGHPPDLAEPKRERSIEEAISSPDKADETDVRRPRRSHGHSHGHSHHH